MVQAQEFPPQKYVVGASLFSAYQRVEGEVKNIEWTHTFGCWYYLIQKRDGKQVWVGEGDLCKVSEQFAFQNANQHIGCVACKESHHETSFCSCGRCFYEALNKGTVDNSEAGTFVACECGVCSLWD